MDYLCFTIANDDRYAVSITDVIAITNKPVITSVPGTHAAIDGMTKFLDTIIPVVNLSKRYSDNTVDFKQMLVLVCNSTRFGLLIHKVTNISRTGVPEGYLVLVPCEVKQKVEN